MHRAYSCFLFLLKAFVEGEDVAWLLRGLENSEAAASCVSIDHKTLGEVLIAAPGYIEFTAVRNLPARVRRVERLGEAEGEEGVLQV